MDRTPKTATPTPWEVQPYEDDESGVFIVGSSLGGLVAMAGMWPTEIDAKDPSRAQANAAMIVEAANSHASLKARIEDLEAALRFIADGYENHNINHVDYRVRVYQVATEVLEAKND